MKQPAISPAVLRLRHDDNELLVCPDAGGAVARFSWRGHDILRPASPAAMAGAEVRAMGMYPLLPYSNRIAFGQLALDSGVCQLRKNFPPEPHSIHGFGWQRVWSVKSHAENSMELILKHEPDADWPFACSARQTLRLDVNGLFLQLSIRNDDVSVMPAGLGMHPYFPLRTGLQLQTKWQGQWPMGRDRLPVGRMALPAEMNFDTPRDVASWQVDHCFSGWNRRAMLAYPQYRVQLQASLECPFIVCFAPNDERAFIALEPVTHVNNAFALATQGVSDTGMKLLAPGQEFSIEMSITVESNDVLNARKWTIADRSTER
jgi:aldose 1-epimerase